MRGLIFESILFARRLGSYWSKHIIGCVEAYEYALGNLYLRSFAVKPICFVLLVVLFMSARGAMAAELTENSFFVRQDGVSVYFDLEFADTVASRSQGLMWRKFMPARHGMLFDFEHSSRIRMWMKNTVIPLDMLFVDEQKKIVFIHEGAEPFSLEIIQTPVDARYTVEINAGESRRYELSVGDSLVLR